MPPSPVLACEHSASSAAFLRVAVVANWRADEYLQVLRTDYAVSFDRIVTSIHYTTDIAGLT